jgi:hypothetical protein
LQNRVFDEVDAIDNVIVPRDALEVSEQTDELY